MARVYVDEQLGNFVTPLQQAGHDVVFAGDTGRSGRTDAWHFREALEQQRVLVTYNRRDFEYLHQLWTSLRTLRVVQASHSGVLTCASEKDYTPTDWLPELVARLRTTVARGHLLRWIPMNQVWRVDQTREDED